MKNLKPKAVFLFIFSELMMEISFRNTEFSLHISEFRKASVSSRWRFAIKAS